MKKVIIVLVCLILIGCQNKTEYRLDANVGDYILYGQYNEEAILWQVIDVNEYNYTLWSDKIIDFKSFDAAGSGHVFYTRENLNLYDEDKDFFNETYKEVDETERVEAFGSGRWSESSLRAWLNADGHVTYKNSPTKSSVFPGKRAYDTEPGFLSNFTEMEKTYIQDVSHKTLLSYDTFETLAGGKELHKYVWNKGPNNSVLNYDSAYYEFVEDKVFLLSIQELAELVQNQGLEYKKEATASAKKDFDTLRSSGNYYENWLRTPYPQRAVAVRTSYPEGNIASWIAASDEIGVVPALVITGHKLDSLEGQGTYEDPYIIK
ncbi:hypothetical protein EZV73_27645 [Acidaminobacter sp. JC074]|uniref:DUF6273 domain-containing protein n=1 Tax=Acidaminobacter sp. JC074 TaxID=2530199 RepID=UPI001F10C416|nr:DUF6273 domain-containing protein [Acidaminobacter sp. JC074]MCH4891376.1 hypothetical protein [Acidaminobacter sp. JC074]